MKKILLTSFLTVFFSSFSPLFSQTLQQSKSFQGTPNLKKILEFDKFNQGLPLKSVEIQVSITTSGGYLGVLNKDINADSEKIIVNAGAAVKLFSKDVKLLNSKFQPVIPELKAAAKNSFLPNNSNKLSKFKELTGSASGEICEQFFDDFSGQGTFHIVVDLQNFIESDNINSIKSIFSPPMCNGEVIIIYSY